MSNVTTNNINTVEIEPPVEQMSSEDMAARIIHTLTYFPKLSHSMLQIGLGPHLPSKVWRPVLDEMIAEGEVKVEAVSVTTPSGRQQSLMIISLAV